MQLGTLKDRFFTIVSPSLPNEWEVDDVLCHLQELSDEYVDSLFEQVEVIWPVSHSLCFAYLLDGVKGVTVIAKELLPEWSRQILGLYETGGLLAARKFMAEPEKLFLDPMKGLSGIDFLQMSERMQLYLNGISGEQIGLGSAVVPQTDTNRILVPDCIDAFPAQSDNSLLYKFIISLQWAHIKSRVYEDALELRHGGVEQAGLWLQSFSKPQKARDHFFVLQCIKSFWRLEQILPGLIRSARPLCRALIKKISAQGGGAEHRLLLQAILQYSFETPGERQHGHKHLDDNLIEILARLHRENTFQVLPDFYESVDETTGSYDFGAFTLVLGDFDFDAATAAIHQRREAMKSGFIAMLAEVLGRKDDDDGGLPPINDPQKSDGVSLILIDDDIPREGEREHDEFSFDNGGAEISEELKALINSIEDDLGELPEAYVQAAAGMAGRGVNSREPLKITDSWCDSPPGSTGHSYDEWDYRRGGYRSSWCTLYEKNVSSVKSTFIEDTLVKYKGPLHKIRRQFEMLRNQNRFARRRRYGDDIDFDALIDALGDEKAGIVPSDRLFLRLLRDRREISTYFLVDMSNSTEGWVGTAVKESLVLMAEAMDIVGDPYAIYGFSGMRRSKSEVFPIKELREPYNQAVKERIAGIGPKEYTRMGPPIRHLTKKILESDSRVRLLLVFSDGKPEDYDDYKGRYAIEDTRKALLEARGAGVHVFCVTIDKTAHEYLGHMFGRGQFVFIDNVDALPGKLVELYRQLTR